MNKEKETKTKQAPLTGYAVDALFKIRVDRYLPIFHIVAQPTVDNLEAMEAAFPETLTVRHTGQFKQNECLNEDRMLFLWDLIITDTEGYSWKKDETLKKVYPMHKLRLLNDLLDVGTLDLEDFNQDYPLMKIKEHHGTIPVYTTASQQGKLLPVIHFFNQPTPNDLRAFKKLNATSQQRKGKKVIISTVPMVDGLCDLYDTLIVDAQGYQCTENENADVKDIRGWKPLIPPYHKLIALKELFADMKERIQGHEKN